MKDILETAIDKAFNKRSKLSDDVLKIDGMSSDHVRHFLNNVCDLTEDTRYLEIGSWKGSTLISAAYKNDGVYIGVDNFAHFGGPQKEFYENKEHFQDHAKVVFYEEDCWELDQKKLANINVYFYDGKHDEESQYKAFSHFKHIFSNPFIAIVDDWNHLPTQLGTFKALEKEGYQVEWKWERTTRVNGDRNDFWNGMFAAVLSF